MEAQLQKYNQISKVLLAIQLCQKYHLQSYEYKFASLLYVPITELASAPVEPRLCFEEAEMDLCTPL